MKKLFSTSLLILAGMLLLLGGCKEDEFPVSGEGNVANNELPVRLAETDYNPDNTYYLLNDNESQDVYFDSGQRSFYVSRPLQFGMDDEHCFQLRFEVHFLQILPFSERVIGRKKHRERL